MKSQWTQATYVYTYNRTLKEINRQKYRTVYADNWVDLFLMTIYICIIKGLLNQCKLLLLTSWC